MDHTSCFTGTTRMIAHTGRRYRLCGCGRHVISLATGRILRPHASSSSRVDDPRYLLTFEESDDDSDNYDDDTVTSTTTTTTKRRRVVSIQDLSLISDVDVDVDIDRRKPTLPTLSTIAAVAVGSAIAVGVALWWCSSTKTVGLTSSTPPSLLALDGGVDGDGRADGDGGIIMSTMRSFFHDVILSLHRCREKKDEGSTSPHGQLVLSDLK